METKTYQTDEEVSVLADMCCKNTNLFNHNEELKSIRLAALYRKYGICLDELIERAIEKADKFVKCPVCEKDNDCICCHGEGKITKERYAKLSHIIRRFQ